MKTLVRGEAALKGVNQLVAHRFVLSWEAGTDGDLHLLGRCGVIPWSQEFPEKEGSGSNHAGGRCPSTPPRTRRPWPPGAPAAAAEDQVGSRRCTPGWAGPGRSQASVGDLGAPRIGAQAIEAPG